ncbi:hypothetical protein J6590_105697, partial [Homalodisca vitripennis]
GTVWGWVRVVGKWQVIVLRPALSRVRDTEHRAGALLWWRHAHAHYNSSLSLFAALLSDVTQLCALSGTPPNLNTPHQSTIISLLNCGFKYFFFLNYTQRSAAETPVLSTMEM